MPTTLAIFSHNENAYSETFIQAHRNLPFEIKFYYGGFMPNYLDGQSISQNKWTNTFQRRKASFLHPENATLTDGELALISSLKKNRVAVVLAEYGVMGATVLRVCRALALPLLVHFHGYDASVTSILNEYDQRYREMFLYAHSVFSVSHAMTEQLAAMGCPRSKIIYNPYGPDDRFFDIRPSYITSHFVAIGRFVDKKAPYFTLLAFQKVLEQCPEAKLTIAGDGPLWNTCLNLVDYLKIGDSVQLPGAINREQWIKFLSNGIAFVQHSLTAENGDSEGTPVAILEAQAAGLPVISTFHAGIADVVINDETGLLTEEKDVEGMAGNMLRIINEDTLAQKLGSNGKKRIQENYTITKHLEMLQNLIEQAIVK